MSKYIYALSFSLRLGLFMYVVIPVQNAAVSFGIRCSLLTLSDKANKKAQLSLTNPRDACEKFARFT